MKAITLPSAGALLGAAAALGLIGCGASIAPTSAPVQDNTVRDSVSNYVSYCPVPQRICIASLYQATQKALLYYQGGGTYNYVLTLDMTTIDLSTQTTDTYRNVAVTTAIDVTGIAPPAGATFTIQGEGRTTATLIINQNLMDVAGTGVSNVNIMDMTFQRPQMTTTQGSVVSMATPGHVSLLIPPGYILPDSLYVPDSGNNTNGRFLRAYHYVTTVTPATMNLDQSADNPQLSFGGSGVGPICNTTTRICDITMDKTDPLPSSWAAADAVIGIKSEGTGTQSYYFNNAKTAAGTNVGFTNVGWLDSARGNWRNITGAFVVNGYVMRRDMVSLGYEPQALSTPGGGPQFGTPGDTTTPIGNIVVNGFFAQNMGDDAIAIFNDTTNTSVIKDTAAPIQIDNDFARTINLYNSCSVQLKFDPSKLTNCSPLEGTNKADVNGYNGCVTNTTPNQCTVKN